MKRLEIRNQVFYKCEKNSGVFEALSQLEEGKTLTAVELEGEEVDSRGLDVDKVTFAEVDIGNGEPFSEVQEEAVEVLSKDRNEDS